MGEHSNPDGAQGQPAEQAMTVVDTLETAATGLPAPIARNVIKSMGRLLTALTDIPAAWLEGRAREVEASSAGRVLLTQTAATQIAAQMNVTPEFAIAASEKFARKLVAGQINKTKIAQHALDALKADPPSADKAVKDISEDWLNSFEEHAAKMSTEQMRLLFGRILAGEIRRPTAFSIKTLNLMAQLDNRAAALFTRFCSLAITSQPPGALLVDARVVANGHAGKNTLAGYGLGFDNLNILFEYGLIISDYYSTSDYRLMILRQSELTMPFGYRREQYMLVPKGAVEKLTHPFEVNGVALTKSGRELFPIVDIEPSDSGYSAELVTYFSQKGFDMREVSGKPFPP